MKIETIERSSGNIFADLGLDNPRESLIQADLALALARAIREHGWTQKEAAAKLRLSQSDVSNIVRGKLSGFSIERLARLLGELDYEVEVVIKQKHKAIEVEVPTSPQTIRRVPPNIVFNPRIPVEVQSGPCPPLARVREG